MAPPWEAWAVLNELPRRLKNWLARPEMISGVVAGSDSGRELSSASPPVEDSSDLLRRRMEALQLDPDDVDRPAAQLNGIQTGLCARCVARGKCMIGLEDELTDPGWGDWRNYCPNATTLTILSTLGSCVEDKQQRDDRDDQDQAATAARWACSVHSGDACSQN